MKGVYSGRIGNNNIYHRRLLWSYVLYNIGTTKLETMGVTTEVSVVVICRLTAKKFFLKSGGFKNYILAKNDLFSVVLYLYIIYAQKILIRLKADRLILSRWFMFVGTIGKLCSPKYKNAVRRRLVYSYIILKYLLYFGYNSLSRGMIILNFRILG